MGYFLKYLTQWKSFDTHFVFNIVVITQVIFHYKKNVPRSVKVLKVYQKHPFILFKIPETNFITAAFRIIYIRIFSFSNDLPSKKLDLYETSIRLWLAYDSGRWIGVVWRNEPVHLVSKICILFCQASWRDGLVFSTLFEISHILGPISSYIRPLRCIYRVFFVIYVSLSLNLGK